MTNPARLETRNSKLDTVLRALAAGLALALPLPIQRVAFIGLENTPVVEPGDFDVMVGGLTQRLTVR